MIGFLDETAALRSIKDTLQETQNATLVVAFWGAGAIESLGLEKRWTSLRIVCNLDSGACNPYEIEKLMRLQNAVVLTNWRLHGKVYLTADRLVMGSSNASSNGLVVEGAALGGWAEANIESVEPVLLRQVAEWCDARFNEAVEITPEKLALARVVWKERSARAPVQGAISSNLLELVKRDPGHPAFAKIKVVQWKRPLSAEALDAHRAAIRSDCGLKGTEIYEGGAEDMEIGDWLVDFDVSGSRPTFTGYWHVVFCDDETNLTFVRVYDAILIPTLGELTITDADMPELVSGNDEKTTRISEVVRKLATSNPSADSKHFDRTMFAIYNQAAALGYRPTEFRSMVEKLGGVTAARQLLGKPKISDGFVRLWELGRLDLTVEALVLRKEWKTLFTDEEKSRARRRLADAGYK